MIETSISKELRECRKGKFTLNAVIMLHRKETIMHGLGSDLLKSIY